jgi:hypothetical protein
VKECFSHGTIFCWMLVSLKTLLEPRKEWPVEEEDRRACGRMNLVRWRPESCAEGTIGAICWAVAPDPCSSMTVYNAGRTAAGKVSPAPPYESPSTLLVVLDVDELAGAPGLGEGRVAPEEAMRLVRILDSGAESASTEASSRELTSMRDAVGIQSECGAAHAGPKEMKSAVSRAATTERLQRNDSVLAIVTEA